jgi:hypothetical protein
VREQRKTVVNLRMTHPDRLAETLFTPAQVQLCLVERSNTLQTEIASLLAAEVGPVLAANSIYWDEPARLDRNTATLHGLLQIAGLYRLKIGSDAAEIVSMLNRLI